MTDSTVEIGKRNRQRSFSAVNQKLHAYILAKIRRKPPQNLNFQPYPPRKFGFIGPAHADAMNGGKNRDRIMAAAKKLDGRTLRPS